MHDYVIVGAGSAGCVLANRLSADGAKVLLLEAGGADKNMFIHMPAGYGVIMMKGWLDWGYTTEPELDGRRIPYPRGMVLGGSSSVNGMAHIRGSSHDYDRWRDAGNPGWGYEDCLPYFKKSEHRPDGGPHRGVDGPIWNEPVRVRNPLSHAWLQAGQQYGSKVNPDFNSGDIEGFGPLDFAIRAGKRCSEADAYLHPAMKSANLEVLTNARATRVMIEKGRAIGVEYVHGGQTHIASAATEVILSAGAINSPQLLMLSGVGDANTLQAVGVAPVHDLKGVGQNLQDHVYAAAKWASLKPVSIYKEFSGVRAGLNLLKYLVFRSGQNAEMGTETVAFLKSAPGLSEIDLQYYLLPMLYADDSPGIAKLHGFMTTYNVARPESRGTISLASADPFAKPLIQPNFLTAEADLRRMREALRIAREVIGQKAYDAYRGEELAPGPGVTNASDIDAYHRKRGSTVWHPVGTCKMGQDEMAVVDSRLRVHGISGLRVADASIMPMITSANTNAPTVMIAEKASDMILGRKGSFGNEGVGTPIKLPVETEAYANSV